MFISHDLNTVRAVCDDIVVLYAGQKVEAMGRAAFSHAPRHPYFHLLATSVPELRPGWLDEVGAAQRAALPLVQAPADRAGICSFLDRCPLRVAGVCDSKTPPRRELEGGVEVFCHRSAGELLSLQKTPKPVHGVRRLTETDRPMHVEPEVFYRFDPSVAPVPVVVDVSRSGRLLPHRLPLARPVLGAARQRVDVRR